MTGRLTIVLLLATSAVTQLAPEVEVEIDVSTGVANEVPASSEESWSDNLDFEGVKITGHEGEDATGSMKPKDLIIRALQKLPDSEQQRTGFTDLLEAHPTGAQEGTEDNELLEALLEIWESRQRELKEAMDAMSESAMVTKGLLDRLESATDTGFQHAIGADAHDAEGEDDDDALAALLDLEEHVGDMDNARDLHDSIGGWPVLASALTPFPRWRLVVPLSPSSSPSSSSSLAAFNHSQVERAAKALAASASERPPTPPSTRAAAAMVVGTAIKNEASFQLWVLESAVTTVNVSAVLDLAKSFTDRRSTTGSSFVQAAEGRRRRRTARGEDVDEGERATTSGGSGGAPLQPSDEETLEAAAASLGKSMKELRRTAVGRTGPEAFRKAFAHAPRYRSSASASAPTPTATATDGKQASIGARTVAANDTLLSALVDMLAGDHFLEGLADSTQAAAADTQKKTLLLLQRRALYALGAALRHNPEVQRCFSELGGLNALKAAVHSTTTSCTPASVGATAGGAPHRPPSGFCRGSAEGNGGSSSSGERLGGVGGAATGPLGGRGAGSGLEAGGAVCEASSPVSGSEWSLRSKALALVLDLLTEHASAEASSGGSSGGEESRSALAPLVEELGTEEWRRLVAEVGLESCRDHDGSEDSTSTSTTTSTAGEGDNAGAPSKVHEVAMLAVTEQWKKKQRLPPPHVDTVTTTGGGSPLAELATQVVLPRLERLRRRYVAAAAAQEDDGNDDADGLSYLNDLVALADAAIATVLAAA